MRGILPVARAIVLAVAGFISCLPVAGCGRAAASEPSIAFSTVPRRAEGGSQVLAPVAGRVSGIKPGQRVVLFAKSGAGVWWVQPFFRKPFTEVNPDSTWSTEIHLGTEYAALLVEPNYRPPATVASLPGRGGSIVAVATVPGTGTYTPPPRRTLTFSGYEWDVRQVPGDRYGPNDYDARNAWVDPEGFLHLALTERDGRWTSAQVHLTRSLGYGTYVFVVRDTSHLDPAAALGLLTWDDLGVDQHHRELDIEVGRRGNPNSKVAQYVVQPPFIAGNVFHFDIPPGVLTHTLRWEPDLARFTTVRGSGARNAGTPVAERAFTSGIPSPGSETVRINLLYFRGSPSPPAGRVEVVIERFEYLP
jgi:hypothetical protein